MHTPSKMYWKYLMDMKKGIAIRDVLIEKHASKEQIEKTTRFISTCEALAGLWMNVARMNSYDV